ncbi:MAG: ARPP-1 family domain-containing protein [Actinomycetota bacterium]
MSTVPNDPIAGVRALLTDGLTVRSARRAGPLTLVPLVGGTPAPPYVTAAEALAAGTLSIGEVGGGSVPQLTMKNHGDLPVLLLDGEHLEGAKQNRVLNASVLAAPRHETVIPVSCVERGRWGYRVSTRSGFSSAPEMAYAELRAMKAQAVAASARKGAGRRADQGAVWADVERKRDQVKGAASPTGAMRDAFRDRRADLRRIVEGVGRPDPEHNGVMAFAGWRPLALDVFDRPETLAALWDRLVQGYAMDALTEQPSSVGEEFAHGFLKGIADPDAETTSHEGVGLGIDVIMTSPTSVADALTWQGAVVHLAAFPRTRGGHASSRSGPHPRADRIARPSERHRARGAAWFHDEGGER